MLRATGQFADKRLNDLLNHLSRGMTDLNAELTWKSMFLPFQKGIKFKWLQMKSSCDF